jgi:hypothetical protein
MYDCLRLVFLLFLIGAFSGPLGMFRGFDRTLPHIMLAAPNGLFPLMSFFLLLRFEVSKSYLPLYMAGKALAVLSMLCWLVFTYWQIQGLSELLALDTKPEFENKIETIHRMVWFLLVGLADMGTILAMALLHFEVPGKENCPQDPSVHAAPYISAAAEEGGR